MAEPKRATPAMGDIIGKTRQRLETNDDPTARLKSLIASTPPAGAAVDPSPTREPVRPTPPANYFPQVQAETAAIPKRKPMRGPARTKHITMRLSQPERDRLVLWCEARNLSLPDGIIALLDLAEGEGPVGPGPV